VDELLKGDASGWVADVAQWCREAAPMRAGFGMARSIPGVVDRRLAGVWNAEIDGGLVGSLVPINKSA